jgi:nucleoside-diphosphate-sugar epimerase
MAEKAHAGELVANADISSFVHVDDAVDAAVDALEWPSGPVNICDDTPAAGHDWIPAFCETVGAPEPPYDTGADRHDWARGADNHYARTQLGWTPRHLSWREGFASSNEA